MHRNRFSNFYTLPLICYSILKMASIEVKHISSSSQTLNQVVVFGTDLPANLCVGTCMSRIPCLRICHIRKQAMHAGLSNIDVPLLMKKEASSLSCKASRRALLPCLPRTDVRMRLFSSTIGKLADTEYNRTLTTDIFLNTGWCDRAGNKQLTGSLQQEYSHG